MTRVHKIELFVVDHENLGIDSTICSIENHAWHSQVLQTKSVDIGQWYDQHL